MCSFPNIQCGDHAKEAIRSLGNTSASNNFKAQRLYKWQIGKLGKCLHCAGAKSFEQLGKQKPLRDGHTNTCSSPFFWITCAWEYPSPRPPQFSSMVPRSTLHPSTPPPSTAPAFQHAKRLGRIPDSALLTPVSSPSSRGNLISITPYVLRRKLCVN